MNPHFAFVIGAVVGAFGVAQLIVPEGQPLQPYNDAITLPIEAFGAHWQIKNFRKHIKYPDGFDDAVARAISASQLLDRPTVISFGPRTYTITRPIVIPVRAQVMLESANLKAGDGFYDSVIEIQTK